MLALPGELHALVVEPQRVERLRRRPERLLLQLFDDVGRERQALADRLGELGDRGEQARLIGGFRLDRDAPLMGDVVDGRIDADRLAELRVLAPQDRFRVAEFGKTLNRRRIEVRVGRDVQIAQDLIEPIGGNRSQVRRLSDLGPEHLGQARPEPVDRFVR